MKKIISAFSVVFVIFFEDKYFYPPLYPKKFYGKYVLWSFNVAVAGVSVLASQKPERMGLM